MSQLQRFFERTRPVRRVKDPTEMPCIQSVQRIWHFPSGDALLEPSGRRDCIVPDIDHIDVPARTVRRIAGAVSLDTATTIHVVEEAGEVIVTEFDKNILL